MPEILSSIVMVSVPFSITTLSSSKEGGVSSSTAICSISWACIPFKLNT